MKEKGTRERDWRDINACNDQTRQTTFSGISQSYDFKILFTFCYLHLLCEF